MPVDEPFDYLDEITKEQSETVEDLVRFDADYREILSTVSSLGSSIYAFKVQRYAITVALISIVLAAIALVPGESWSAVWAWISSAWS